MNLFKREYLRGIIDGQTVKLTERYTLEELNSIYKDYLNDNPDTVEEIENLNNGSSN